MANHSDDAEFQEAERGASGDASRRAGAGSGSASEREGSRSVAARVRRRSTLPISANDEELWIGDTDITAARSVLAEIGADGSIALEKLTATETISLPARVQDLTGAIAAVQARALVHLEEAVKQDSLRREETPKQAVKIARSEASKALKQSKSCVGQSMSSSRRLVLSMPGMLRALAQGRIVATSAHKVGRTMGPATPAQRAQVDEILTAHLPYLEGCGPEELAGEAAKVLHGLDPRGAADRHRTAKRDRNVTVRRGEHGMCTVTAHLPALDGARIRKGLSVAAEKARAHGDRRGHQQIMADLFADALIGRGEGIDPSTLEIGVIITDRALLAPEHADAATIEGYGPVPYEHIRQEMLAAATSDADDPDLTLALRQLYLDPDDGQLVAVESASREFPPALARFLRLGHQTCRAPYCDANIRQNDHIVPRSQGGPTYLLNGNGVCVGDNQKEEAGEKARVITDENGVRRTVEWTSRYGQKASRRGINFDPLGTGLRLLDRSARQMEAASDPENGAPDDDTAFAEHPGADEERRDPIESVPPGGPEDADASFHRAFARVEGRALDLTDPHPRFRNARRNRHWLLQGRTDYIFTPNLTIIDSQ